MLHTFILPRRPLPAPGGVSVRTGERRRIAYACVVGCLLLVSASDRATGAGCVGDCNGTDGVTINELLVGVNIALGVKAVTACDALDANGNGTVTIGELILAVDAAIRGCPVHPSPSPVPSASATTSATTELSTPISVTATTTSTVTAPPENPTSLSTRTHSPPFSATPTETPTATPTPRYGSNGDGTITDHNTGLMWETKVAWDGVVGFSHLHDADNTYAWSGTCARDGRACQPSVGAAIACATGVEDETAGCAQCGDFSGVCSASDTIWTWVLELNTAQFAGYSDWRVPKVDELVSIVDYTAASPAVDEVFQGESCGRECTDVSTAACSCTRADVHWTSTIQYQPSDPSEPNRPDAAFWVSFRSGQVGGGVVTTQGQRVRAVRGGLAVATRTATPTPRYVDNSDGTIHDQQTGLMWGTKVTDRGSLHDVDTKYPWSGTCALNEAKYCQPTEAAAVACEAGVEGDATGCAQCSPADGSCSATETIWTWVVTLNAANFAGYADWRVPKVDELQSIIDYSAQRRPPVDRVFHGNSTCPDVTGAACSRTKGDFYWSATTDRLHPTAAWSVWFYVGNSRNDHIKDQSYYVRAVRGEHSAPASTITSTPTRTPTPTPRIVRISIGSGHGLPGDAAIVTVSLVTAGADVAATANDIQFEADLLDLNPTDCFVNPAIKKDLIVSLVEQSALSKRLRFFIQSDQNHHPIPDGPLYTCTFHVNPSAVPGDVPLTNENMLAFGPGGPVIDNVVGSTGLIMVSLLPPVSPTIAPPTSTPTPTRTPTSAPRYVDNGDGTISDYETGLMWEKKDQGGGQHDRGAQYPWAGVCKYRGGNCQPDAEAAATCQAETGGAYGCSLCASDDTCIDSRSAVVTTIWGWLNQLNATSFAGHRDWHIPTVAAGVAAELDTIFDATAVGCASTAPCVPREFDTACVGMCTLASCSCTQPNRYWSATTRAGEAGKAWIVNFYDDTGQSRPKSDHLYVRAVRRAVHERADAADSTR